MKQIITFSLLCILSILSADAQVSYESKSIKIKPSAEINLHKIKHDWGPKLVNLEAPFPGNESYRNYLELIKQDIKAREDYTNVQTGSFKTGSADMPILKSSFRGNDYDLSVPCDNDVAVSNDRKVVSVVNSSIYMYDANTPNDTLLMSLSLDAWSDTLKLTGAVNNKYDPKVAYDPEQDRFILLCLNSSQDSNRTKIIVGFSQTNDPTEGWNLYAIDGNPLSTYTWSDYPMVAITKDEVFITINSIGVNEPWQTGFKQTFIWQIDKYDGYIGVPLDSRLYYDIEFGSKPIRNLCPVKGGSGLKGPEIYFLSDRNFAMTNDTVFLLKVTGLQDDPSTDLEISYLISDLEYGAPPNGWQIDNNFDLFLSTNDARILGAFIEDDEIHFVGNTAAYLPDTVRAGIYHGRIKNVAVAPELTANIIVDNVLDFGYPNISYTGTHDDDMQAIISYDHTADSIWPGFSATFWNQHEGYSERLEIKEGENFVSILGSQFQRWGDYSGSQLLYDEPGTIWVSGFYGGVSLANQPFVNIAWVAELESPFSPQVGIEKPVEAEIASEVFPNPVKERFTVEFENSTKRWMTFSVYDEGGREVRMLLQEIVKTGSNIFSFYTDNLSAGVYFLLASDKEGVVFSEKIVVQ